MFALRNVDVDALNQQARALHKTRGDLGEDHALKTATGAQQSATGDRIQFTGNAVAEASTFAEAATATVATGEQIAAFAEAKEDRLIADTFAYEPETGTGEAASARALEALAGVANAAAEPPSARCAAFPAEAR
jgi:hypothetical protein